MKRKNGRTSGWEPGPKEEPETRPFVLRFLLRRPHLAPAPGGLVLALGRLVGEAFPLP